MQVRVRFAHGQPQNHRYAEPKESARSRSSLLVPIILVHAFGSGLVALGITVE